MKLFKTLWDRYSRPWRYSPRHSRRGCAGLWPADDQEWIAALARMAQRRLTLALPERLQTV